MTGEKITMISINLPSKKQVMKKLISTKEAPAAIGPYSQAIEAGNTLYVSGQIPLDPETGKLVEGNITEQTEQVFRNISAILKAAGYSFSNVVKSTVFLSNITDFKFMNEIYGRHYTDKQPARSTVAVKELPMGALVEIDTIAVK
jgi:2-iminobutanoate/2-iminopropanoate deaminase